MQSQLTEHQHYWRKHCGNKKQHATQEAAFYAAEDQSRKFGKMVEEYFCYSCAGWHTGSERLDSLSRAQQAS